MQPCITRPIPKAVVDFGIKDTKRLRLFDWKNLNPIVISSTQLFELNLSTGFFDSLLKVLSLVLRKTFLQSRRSTVNQFLSLFQTKTTSLLNGLYNLQFSATNFSENYIERCLLLSGCSSTCTRTSSNCNSSSSRRNSILRTLAQGLEHTMDGVCA